MNTLIAPQGQYTLNRYPVQKKSPLRAWDAADEYILLHLQQQEILNDSLKLLIVNDAFGALSIAMANYNPCSISDSLVSQQALIENTKINNIPPENITLKNILQPVNQIYDLIIIKIPKNLAMLEDELYRIRNCCHEKTIIIAAAMSKHIHTSTLKLFERIIGTTTSSLARKKSRLIFSQLNSELDPGNSPYPSRYTLDTNGESYINHANVFSREKLDLGSRFFLQHIPQSEKYTHILDLACGNGVLGIASAQLNPKANIQFVDESYMAVASAKKNVDDILGNSSRFNFKVTDCLQGIEDNSIDLILNNPPFHQNHVIGDFIAWEMFNEARKKLKTDGEIIIVGNRHLGYHIKLKKIFENCELIADSKKFIILKSVK